MSNRSEYPNKDGDPFWPDNGYPIEGWRRIFTMTKANTLDHGEVSMRFVYTRKIRAYDRNTEAFYIYDQFVEDIDA